MTEPKKMITFNSTGGNPGPKRAALLAKAREHLGDPWVEYTIVDIDGHIHGENGDDLRDHSLMARSRAEALVAYFDYLNEFRPSPSGYDNFDDDFDVHNIDRFFEPNDHMENQWLYEIRDTRTAHYVSELNGQSGDVQSDDTQEDWRRGQKLRAEDN